MKGGFTYRGVDIAELGLEYAPEIEETYVYRPAASTLPDETFDGHNGGYYYGITYQPKEFTLRCFFEEERIDRGVMAKVYATFKKGSSGRLVFQRRPWCYYNVVIEDVLSTIEVIENDNTGTMKIQIAKPNISISSGCYQKYGEDLVHAAEIASVAFDQIKEITGDEDVEKVKKAESFSFLFNKNTFKKVDRPEDADDPYLAKADFFETKYKGKKIIVGIPEDENKMYLQTNIDGVKLTVNASYEYKNVDKIKMPEANISNSTLNILKGVFEKAKDTVK